jgi:hypothetical protein
MYFIYPYISEHVFTSMRINNTHLAVDLLLSDKYRYLVLPAKQWPQLTCQTTAAAHWTVFITSRAYTVTSPQWLLVRSHSYTVEENQGL